MAIGRIVLEKGLTEEQLIALHMHYKKEEIGKKEQLKITNPETFDRAKNIVECMKSDILKSYRENLGKGA